MMDREKPKPRAEAQRDAPGQASAARRGNHTGGPMKPVCARYRRALSDRQDGRISERDPVAGLPALLQPDYRDRLVKLLGMLGSDHDGERATAARMVEEHRRKCGLSWHEIVIPAPAEETRAPPGEQKARKPRKPSAPAWQAKAKDVMRSASATEWERNFALGLLARWHGRLTEKQALCLEKLWFKCGGKAEKAA